MADFYIKQNDTAPSIQATLMNDDDTVIDLTSAAAVYFHMALGGVLKVSAEATIVDAAGGVVRYDWQEGDTETPGTYDIEWEILFADGTIRTIPNWRHDQVEIYPELGTGTGS